MQFYLGTYTHDGRSRGIHQARLDAESGALHHLGTVAHIADPSFVTLHPNGRTVYAVSELTEYKGQHSGAVAAFGHTAKEGTLRQLAEHASRGGAPCYLTVDRGGRWLLVANYVGGSVALLPIHPDGALGDAVQVVHHAGSGPVADRQEGPHAHCVILDPDERFALVADLGIDRVMVYRFDAHAGSLEWVDSSGIGLPPGTGPRHLAFHPQGRVVYVTGELNSTVTAMRYEPRTGALEAMQTITTLEAGTSGENLAAHVVVAGGHLYMSNRGRNEIVVFAISPSDGTLSFEQRIPSGGNWPRHFAIDPSGRWLLVAHERSDSVVVFRLDPATGRLTSTNAKMSVPAPVCVRFNAR